MAVSIVNIALRGFQLLFAIVILGISVALIRAHKFGSLPATLGFTAFVAAVAVIGAFVGLAASFVSVLEGVIGLGIDAVVAIINLAGGILIAIKMNGASCHFDSDSNAKKLVGNDMINGGTTKYQKQIVYGATEGEILSHCRSAQADMAFMFLTVAVLIGAALMTFLRMRKGY